MRLQGKTVLVTAATRGIGLAIAKACAQEGGRVFLGARNPEKAKKIAAALTEEGLWVYPVYNDADRPESYGTMVEQVLENCRRIDVLVNNFGGSDRKQDLDIAGTEPEVFLSTVSRNLGSVYRATRLVLPHMGPGGSIINISSVGSRVPDLTQVGYGTAKAAINHLTKLIAVQEAHRGIRCNAILPGMTATDAVTANLTEEYRAGFLRHIPLGRMGLPEEIAQAAVYFASGESAYTTGQILAVSGGFGLATPLYGDRQSKL